MFIVWRTGHIQGKLDVVIMVASAILSGFPLPPQDQTGIRAFLSRHAGKGDDCGY